MVVVCACGVGGGGDCSGCVLRVNEAFFFCWPIFKRSHSSSSHAPVRALVTEWKDFSKGC